MDRSAVSGMVKGGEQSRLSGEIVGTALGIARRLLGSKLLLTYVGLGVLSGLRFGAQGLAISLANYLVLLPVYVLLIRLWTRDEPTVAQANGQAKRVEAARRRDLALTFSLLVVNLITLVWFWADGLPAVVMDSVGATLRGLGWDRGLANTMANAAESILLNLLPSLALVFGLFRLRPSEVGFKARRLGLGLVLVALGIGFAYVIKLALGSSTELFDPRRTLPLVLALFLGQILTNALQEELVFRGVIFTRLLSWLSNPLHALVLMALLFNLLHIPSYVSQGGASLWDWLGISDQPTGLVWGYLFYRTRSIWPGILWHGSNIVLGVLFLGLG